MGVEIERKFLTTNEDWRSIASSPVRITQGYLSHTLTLRIRIADEEAFLTIKGPTVGITRLEFEYSIPYDDAVTLLSLCPDSTLVEKYRYSVDYQGSHWEIDEFLGLNSGLIVVELELSHEDQEFDRPVWLGEEVTHDHRYTNSRLSIKPFCDW